MIKEQVMIKRPMYKRNEKGETIKHTNPIWVRRSFWFNYSFLLTFFSHRQKCVCSPDFKAREWGKGKQRILENLRSWYCMNIWINASQYQTIISSYSAMTLSQCDWYTMWEDQKETKPRQTIAKFNWAFQYFTRERLCGYF